MHATFAAILRLKERELIARDSLWEIQNMDLAHPPTIKRVRAFQPSSSRRSLWLALAVAVYAVVLPQCYLTSGDPRRTAIAQLEALEAEAPPEAKPAGVWVGGKLVAETEGEGAETDEAVAEPAETAEAVDEFGGIDGDLLVRKQGAADAKETKEDWRKAFEGAKVETEIKGQDGRSLPAWWLPSAVACAALFLSLSGTALFFLLCHWLVGFKAWALFAPVNEVTAGTVLLIEPVKHRGKAALTPVVTDARGQLGCNFQRQRYDLCFSASSSANPDAFEACVGRGKDNGALVLVTCPVNRPVGHYTTHPGLNPTTTAQRLEAYGRNVVRIPQPQMVDLLKQQLVSPLAIFQIFCALLWMLDEYWQYTIFTLFSIVALESTTCFQRMKTFSTLGGMANKPMPLLVHRDKKWSLMTTEDLLPGDLVSLLRQRQAPTPAGATGAAAGGNGEGGRDKRAKANFSDGPLATSPSNGAVTNPGAPAARKPAITMEVVPCDMVLLSGSAVVNESSLTGESVPQMKDALKFEGDGEASLRALDIEGRDRVHTLFSGTSLVALTAPSSASSLVEPASAAGTGPGRVNVVAPDGGCLCYVLRTGFSSSQGELMQMIEFSTQQVSADSKETGLALLVLLAFALASAGNVLVKGLEKKDRTTHELLLKCVIIITSVVPRQLPVQMAMAVNTALMSLMKGGIFCTEPYRVPFAGKISHCLFDKTGTLTTDQLVPVGVVCHSARATGAGVSTPPPRVPVHDASLEAALVLAACHALVELPGDGSTDKSTGKPKASSVIGDPIELAALKGVEWRYDASKQECVPGNFDAFAKGIASLKHELAALKTGDLQRTRCEARIQDLESREAAAQKRAAANPIAKCTLKQRHHFSSDLQRMSVTCNVFTKASSSTPQGYCLVKGSPEALDPLLAKGAMPSWYWPSYNSLAEEGMRVLALAYKKVDAKDQGGQGAADDDDGVSGEKSRSWVESNLSFAGFIAFTCKTRSDSPTVVSALLESGHQVAMLTGDAPLTALKVAQGIGLCTKTNAPPLTLRRKPGTGGSGQPPAAFEWVGILARHQTSDDDDDDDKDKDGAGDDKASGGDGRGSEAVAPIPLAVPGVRALAQKHDLCVLESILDEASAAFHASTAGLAHKAAIAAKAPASEDASKDSASGSGSSSGSSGSGLAEVESGPCAEGDVFSEVDAIRVFARCSPHGKAKVIRALQRNDPENHVLMCGDGGNDVGALKQADVGLALLSGYGNANTTDLDSSSSASSADGQPQQLLQGGGSDNSLTLVGKSGDSNHKSAEKALNDQAAELAKRGAQAAKLRKTLLAEKQKELSANMPQRLQEEVAAMKARGEGDGVMAQMAAVKNVTMQIKREMDLEAQRLNRVHGNVFDDSNSGKDSSDPMAGLDDATLPVVRPGDASVAAPFTSRTPSVRSVVTLIRQGRCTLLSALQQQQIMMLECIISAYALSALSLEGARSSERQMMASGWLIMTASLAFSYTQGVEAMHPVRPLRKLFHPAVFLSMLGQAAIHVFCMAYGVSMAKEVMGPEELKAVLDFHKAARAKELPEQQNSDEDPWAEMKAMWMTPFKPNLLNTVVFLVETSQMIAVLFVNYKGRPWMKGVLENHPLFLSVFLCVAGVAGCAWGIRPELNELIHLEAFPDDEFRWKVLGLVGLAIVGTFVWDRLILCLFAPEIFAAMVSEAKKTTMQDLTPILMTMAKVAGGFFVLATGNVLVLGLIGWWWYKNKQAKENI